MKILFLTRLYYPHIGGVEKHVENLSLNLKKNGHKVTILTTKYEKNLKDSEFRFGIKIIRFPQPKIKFFGLLYTWYWMVKNINLFKENDIMHIHDVFIWYWPIRLLLPFKKVYVTFHGQWGVYPINKIDIFQKKIGAWFSSKNLSIGEYIPKYYGIKSNVVSYGATSPSQIKKIKNDLVLYVGRLDKSLPVRKILQVFEKIKKQFEYEIKILGDGELKKEVQKFGQVHGFIDPESYYKSARFVFASGYLTIIEALSNKCLVFVTYDNPLQKDYYQISPFKDFIVIGKDSADLYKKFKYFKSHKRESDLLINKGYVWAKEQTWDNMTNIYSKMWNIVSN